MSRGAFWARAKASPPRKVQHAIRVNLLKGAREAWLADGTLQDRARLHTHSGWAAGAALLRCPTERALRLLDDDVRVAIKERLHVCGADLRDGWHAHCCKGLAGIRTTCRHHPLVHEWCHILTSAGRVVTVEQRDPTMGPTSRLDLVEHYSSAGGPASYDVSVHTAFRQDDKFVKKCATTPGHAAELGGHHKGAQQYKHRVPGSRLVPLTAEAGGRWHQSVPPLARKLAREYIQRTPGIDEDSCGAVVARWGGSAFCSTYSG